MSGLVAPEVRHAEAPSRLVRLRLNPARLWRWQLWLAGALAAEPGARVEVAFGAPRPLPGAVTLLLRLEALVFRGAGERASDLLSRADFDGFGPPGGGGAGLVFDLVGEDGAAAPEMTVVRPLFCGAADDAALVAALLDRRNVRLAFEDRPGEALPAVHSHLVLGRALDTTFGALLRLCLQRAADGAGGGRGGARGPGAGRVGSGAVGAFLLRALAERAADRLDALCRRAPRWRVGWRALGQDGGIAEHHRLPQAGYSVLPDDGRRYYADPFVLVHGGRRTLFVEELPFGTGKGLISAADIAEEGTVGVPRPVLELDGHASYPFVFHHAGEVWMVPETVAARRVDLFRAVRLPDRWERVATLLDGIQAADVTLACRGGLWWMFAATRDWRSSDRDALSLFSARELTGPWTAHPGNPVLIDRRAARPAGALFWRGGALWRPAQDATDGYGSALTLSRVDVLTPDRYAQTLQATVRPGPSWPGRGIHTLNTGGGIEVVDGLAAADRPGSTRAGGHPQ